MSEIHPLYRSTQGNNEEMKRLLEENQQYLKLILSSAERTRRYILWGRVMSLIYLIIIITPIILAIIYLPPLFEQVVAPYQELLGSAPAKGQVNQGLFDELQGLIGQ